MKSGRHQRPACRTASATVTAAAHVAAPAPRARGSNLGDACLLFWVSTILVSRKVGKAEHKYRVRALLYAEVTQKFGTEPAHVGNLRSIRPAAIAREGREELGETLQYAQRAEESHHCGFALCGIYSGFAAHAACSCSEFVHPYNNPSGFNFQSPVVARLLYVFAIAFRQMTRGTQCGEQYFANVPAAMQTLFISGALLDEVGSLVKELFAEKLYVSLTMMYVFIIMSAITAPWQLVSGRHSCVNDKACVGQHETADFREGFLMFMSQCPLKVMNMLIGVSWLVIPRYIAADGGFA